MPDSALHRFIRDHQIAAQVETAPAPTSGPWADDPLGAMAGASHWTVTLSSPVLGEPMVVPFHQGSALTEPPTAADVLECIASDASSGDEDFDSWCANYGYDTDSRSAYATWEAVRAQTDELRRFLGDGETFEALLYGEDED